MGVVKLCLKPIDVATIIIVFHQSRSLRACHGGGLDWMLYCLLPFNGTHIAMFVDCERSVALDGYIARVTR